MRRFVIPLLIAFMLLVAALGCVAVERVDTHSPTLDVVVVPVNGLRHEVTLVQATDLHGWEFGSHESELRSLLKGRRIDAAVMTGDILDEADDPKQPAYDLAATLASATPRVYYLPGNHDPDDLGSALATHGVTPLRPGVTVPIDPGDPRGREVALAYGRDSASIRAARGSGDRLLVIASHTPPNGGRISAGASLPGDHLFIAGHTHGGQIRLPFLGAISAPTTWDGEEGGRPGTNEFRAFPDLHGFLVLGMYRRDGQRIYVAGGLGATLVSARFLDRSALVLYRFVPAK